MHVVLIATHAGLGLNAFAAIGIEVGARPDVRILWAFQAASCSSLQAGAVEGAAQSISGLVAVVDSEDAGAAFLALSISRRSCASFSAY